MLFATYVHPDALATVKPVEEITFVGRSLPYFVSVCRELVWTEADYAAMTRDVLAISQRASCPVLSMHGGGYLLESAVASAVAHIDVLAGPG